MDAKRCRAEARKHLTGGMEGNLPESHVCHSSVGTLRKSFPAIGFLTAKMGTILPDHDCASLWGFQSCLEVLLLVPGEHLLVTTSNAYHSLRASYSTYAAITLSSSFSLKPRFLNKPFNTDISTSSPSHSLLNPLKASCCH